jgi:hypothetical protein
MTRSAFHIVQALRSIIPQAQPSQTGHVHRLHRTQTLCIVRGGQAAGRDPLRSLCCVTTIRGRSARVEPVSDIRYIRAVVCEHSTRFGASCCNVGKPRQTREVWGVKLRRFDTVKLLVYLTMCAFHRSYAGVQNRWSCCNHYNQSLTLSWVVPRKAALTLTHRTKELVLTALLPLSRLTPSSELTQIPNTRPRHAHALARPFGQPCAFPCPAKHNPHSKVATTTPDLP